MPYITQERRDAIYSNSVTDFVSSPQNSGELNYLLTTILHAYYLNKGGRYQQVNDTIGALECAKLEFYRRIAAPYEDTKIQENGDVY